MILCVGSAGTGSLAQLHHTLDAAQRWMTVMDEVAATLIVWQTHEVEATGIVEAIAEVSRQMLTP